MKKILLPTDFSENSWNAISYAIHLFKDDMCTFFLLNTYTPAIYNSEQGLGCATELNLEDTLKNTSTEQLKILTLRISAVFGDNPNHQFETMSKFDFLISGINEIMESHTIDMIVMGTVGATGAKGVLFGSNTVQIFKNVKCSILAIPEGFNYKTPTSILFPTDYGIPYQTSQFRSLLGLAATHHSKINILHVLADVLTETQLKNKAALEKVMLQNNHEFHELKGNHVMHGIMDFQDTTAVDMLVMINNKKSFFENIFFKSTVNQIGFHLTLPFLVMPSSIKNQN